MDLVITVSEYWKNYLDKLSCSTKVIYNSFNIDEFIVPESEVKQFKIKYDLSEDIPIIYIGNAHRQKGVYEVYEALKKKNYQLVMSGSHNYAKDLPVKFLSLDKHDFHCLLHCADVVVIMSHLTEGWNRIAHEALLCKTPVIGSGTGGMKELLEKSGQRIVTDISHLDSTIQEVLEKRKELAEKGYAFVKRFDKNYFTQEWISAIEELLKK